MIELAIDGLFRAEPDAVCDWAGRALAAAQALGDRPLVAAASAMLTLGHAVAGSTAAAQAQYAEAADLVAALRDEELAAASTPRRTCARRRRTWTATTRPSRTPSARSGSAAPRAICIRP